METTQEITLWLNGGRKVDGLFSNSAETPQGYNRYAIRHSDNDWDEFCTLEPHVLVNRAGYFFTRETIDFPKGFYNISKWT